MLFLCDQSISRNKQAEGMLIAPAQSERCPTRHRQCTVAKLRPLCRTAPWQLAGRQAAPDGQVCSETRGISMRELCQQPLSRGRWVSACCAEVRFESIRFPKVRLIRSLQEIHLRRSRTRTCLSRLQKKRLLLIEVCWVTDPSGSCLAY